MLKSTVIGVGQCGGNQVDCLMSMIEKIKTTAEVIGVAANTSTEDINSLKHIAEENRVMIGTNGGVAKNRKVGKKLLRENKGTAIPSLVKLVGDSRLTILLGSLDGGTASSMLAPLARTIRAMVPTTVVHLVVTVPSLEDLSGGHRNTLAALAELRDENGKFDFSISIIDNSRYDGKFANLSSKELWSKINHHAMKPIAKLITNERSSDVSNLDVADLLALYRTKGILRYVYGAFPTKGADILEIYEDKLNRSPYVGDTNNVENVGMYMELENYDVIPVREMRDVFRSAGARYQFIGSYLINKPKAAKTADTDGKTKTTPVKNQMIVVLTGLVPERDWLRRRERLVDQVKDVERNQVVDIDNKDAWWEEDDIDTATAVTIDDIDQFL